LNDGRGHRPAHRLSATGYALRGFPRAHDTAPTAWHGRSHCGPVS
jgi:hypothetical protein